jgi:hypothetical protein
MFKSSSRSSHRSTRRRSSNSPASYDSGPQLTLSSSSPKELFHKRYRLNEEITPRTSVVYATDQLSRPVAGKWVLIHVFHDLAEYNVQLDLFKRLRSRFVANLLDHWMDEALGTTMQSSVLSPPLHAPPARRALAATAACTRRRRARAASLTLRWAGGHKQ